MTDLLPCDHCGGEARQDSYAGLSTISCSRCGVSVSVHQGNTVAQRTEAAKAKWNRRIHRWYYPNKGDPLPEEGQHIAFTCKPANGPGESGPFIRVYSTEEIITRKRYIIRWAPLPHPKDSLSL